MSGNTLDQDDLLQDLDDAVQWMLSDYGGVTYGRIGRIRELLDQLERTIK